MDQPAFVTVDDFDDRNVSLDEAPRSAEHYLQQVMVSRKKCPDVVSVDIDRSHFKHANSLSMQHNNNEQFKEAPSLEWQHDRCNHFSYCRSQLIRCRQLLARRHQLRTGCKLPPMQDEQAWKAFIHNAPSQLATTGNESTFADHIGTPPALSLVLAFSESQTTQLFEYLVQWFVDDGYSPALAHWIYTMLALLEKPLLPDVCAALRSLAKQCRLLRSTMTESSSGHSQQQRPSIHELTLFIAIASIYFEQKDLSDHYSY